MVREVQSITGRKAGQQEKVAGHVMPSVRKQRVVILMLIYLPPLPLFIQSGPQPLGWYHPHLQIVLPQLTLSGNIITDTPRLVS